MKRKSLTSVLVLLLAASPSLVLGDGFVGMDRGKLRGLNLGIDPGSGSTSGRQGDGNMSSTSETAFQKQCSLEEAKKLDNISVGFLKALMYNPAEFNVAVDANNAVNHVISIPNLVTGGCLGESGLSIEDVNIKNGAAVAFKINPSTRFTVEEEREGNKVSRELHGYEHLVQCLKGKGLYEEGKPYPAREVSRADLESRYFNVKPQVQNETLQSQKLYFMSPNRDPANISVAYPSTPEVISPTYKQCFQGESLSEEGYTIYKNESIAVAYEACSSNDLKKMLAAYRDLDKSLTGNAAGAFQLAHKALQFAIKDQLEQNSKEILEKLENFAENELQSAMESLEAGDLKKSEARDVLDEYNEILNELNTKVLSRAQDEITYLVEELKTAKEPRKTEIKERIEELNEEVEKYGKSMGNDDYGHRSATALAKRFGLGSEAIDFQGFALKSLAWGKVDSSSDASKVDEAIRKELKKFKDNKVSRWKQEYRDYEDANDGDFRPARRYGQAAGKYMSRMQMLNQRYMEGERRAMGYCQQGFFGVKNPVRCQREMSPQAQQRRRAMFDWQMQKYRSEESYYLSRHDYYDQVANQARMRDRQGGFDPFGFGGNSGGNFFGSDSPSPFADEYGYGGYDPSYGNNQMYGYGYGNPYQNQQSNRYPAGGSQYPYQQQSPGFSAPQVMGNNPFVSQPYQQQPQYPMQQQYQFQQQYRPY